MNNKKIYTLITLIFMLTSISFNVFAEVDEETQVRNLTVNYIDVGQAESILIQTPNGKNMLIDAGETKEKAVLSYLKNLKITKLDIVVSTHPHIDHISEMTDVINNFEIGNFYMPKAYDTIQAFSDMTTALSNKQIPVIEAKAGVSINLDKNINCNIVAPVKTGYDNLNNYSAVIHLEYGSTSFLFTGDAEELSENEILSSGVNIKSDVLKVGHHADRNATSQKFLDAVNPSVAIISLGKNNFGHPHKEVVNKLVSNINKFRTTKVYTTSEYGNIIIRSDGEKLYLSNFVQVNQPNETSLASKQ